jgi:hypothetical protein
MLKNQHMPMGSWTLAAVNHSVKYPPILNSLILTGSFLSQYHITWIFMHDMISWLSIYTTWLSDSIKVAQNCYEMFWSSKSQVPQASLALGI